MRLYVLTPVLVFITLFLGSGVYFTVLGEPKAFYKISAITCVVFALFVSLLFDKGPFSERVKLLNKGLAREGSANIIAIFILVGGLSGVTQGSGCMQEAVTAIMHYIPPGYVISAVFLLTCLASMALGTSNGVISLLGPFAAELAQGNKATALWCLGAVVSGAAFGDNLSLISDTSIAASQTINVAPRDKFYANAPIALCACCMLLGFYALYGIPKVSYLPLCDQGITYWQLLPYVTVITISLLGVPVLIAAFVTTFFTLILNITLSDYTLIAFSKDWLKGMWGMMPITILTFFLGALQSFIVRHGGVQFLERKYKTPHIATAVIAKMGVVSTVLFANNTVAILFSGYTVKKIVQKNNLSPALGASILDIFATATKCIIPHGTQLLLASSFIGCSPLTLLPYCGYSFALVLSSLFFLNKKEHKS